MVTNHPQDSHPPSPGWSPLSSARSPLSLEWSTRSGVWLSQPILFYYPISESRQKLLVITQIGHVTKCSSLIGQEQKDSSWLLWTCTCIFTNTSECILLETGQINSWFIEKMRPYNPHFQYSSGKPSGSLKDKVPEDQSWWNSGVL